MPIDFKEDDVAILMYNKEAANDVQFTCFGLWPRKIVMKLNQELVPVWRTIQIVQICKGLEDGLRKFIIGPFFYDIFSKLIGHQDALKYTAIIWAIYCGLTAVLEIPTGAIADIFGRTKAVVWSLLVSLFFGMGIASLHFLNDFYLVFIVACAAFILRSLAYALHNGAFSAWVADSVNELSPGFGYERLLTKGYSYYFWSILVGAVLGVTAYLLGVAYFAFIIGSFICLSCATYCIAEMRDPKYLHFEKLTAFWPAIRSRFSRVVKTGFQICNETRILWYILIIAAAYDLLLGVVKYLWPVAMGAIFGKNKWSFEWYFMVFTVPFLMGAGSWFFSKICNDRAEKLGSSMSKKTLRKYFIGGIFVAALPVMVLGIVSKMGAVSFPIFASAIMLMEVTHGVNWPAYESLMNCYIPLNRSGERATVLSIAGMIDGLLLLFLLVPSSGTSGTTTLEAWMLPAGILLIVATVGNFILRRYEKKEDAKSGPIIKESYYANPTATEII